MQYMLLFFFNILFSRVLLIYIFFYVVLLFFTFFLLFDNFFYYSIIFFSILINFLCIILVFSYLYSALIFRFINKSLTLFYLFFVYGFVLLHIFFFFILFQIFFGIFAGKAFFSLIFYEMVQTQRSTYFKFNTKLDIKPETPNLFRCKLAAGIYTSIYVCYKLLSIFIFMFYLFWIKILLFLGFCGTLYICFCEITNYVDYKYDVEKCPKGYLFLFWGVDFCLRNVEFTASLLLTFFRIAIQIIYELLSLRYALPGGIVVCGGPGIVGPNGDSNNDNIPPFDNLTPEESKKLEEKLRNNTTLTVAAYRPLEIVVDLLPEDPKKLKTMEEYLEAIVKNLDAFKTMPAEKYKEYEQDYGELRRKNPEFKVFCVVTPDTFSEFLSCITPMIAGSVNEKGEIDAVAVPINGGKAADFVLRGKGIQAKMTSNLSAGNLEEQNQKYKLMIEDENLNFCVRTTYDDLNRAGRIQAYIENNKDVLKGQEAVRRQTLPNVVEYAKEYLDFASKNCEKVQQTQQRIQKEGYLQVIAKEGKQPQIEEIRIPKHDGYPAITKVVRKVIKNGIK